MSIPMETLEIASISIGIVGLGVAVWTVLHERNTRHMYREKCITRCKDLVETARELARSTSEACRIKDAYFDDLIASHQKAIRPLRELSDQIHAIYVAENQLVRFCERLNEEHREGFGSPTFEDIKEEIGQYSDFLATLRESQHKEALPGRQVTTGADGR